MLSVQEAYDKIAEDFKNTRIYTWKWTDKFINNLDKNSLILDIGSGNGRNTIYKDHTIFGLDISFNQLLMNNNINKLDIQSDMTCLPFKNNIFDSIILIASFHHLKTIQERNECLKEIKRVIKKDGKILLSVWSINQPKKTKRIFLNYGDNYVEWNNPQKTLKISRYYYIFELNELKTLLSSYFTILEYKWDCGNEIFILS